MYITMPDMQQHDERLPVTFSDSPLWFHRCPLSVWVKPVLLHWWVSSLLSLFVACCFSWYPCWLLSVLFWMNGESVVVLCTHVLSLTTIILSSYLPAPISHRLCWFIQVCNHNSSTAAITFVCSVSLRNKRIGNIRYIELCSSIKIHRCNLLQGSTVC